MVSLAVKMFQITAKYCKYLNLYITTALVLCILCCSLKFSNIITFNYQGDINSIQSSLFEYVQVAVTTISGYILLENLIDFLNGSKKLDSIKITFLSTVAFVLFLFITSGIRFYNNTYFILSRKSQSSLLATCLNYMFS